MPKKEKPSHAEKHKEHVVHHVHHKAQNPTNHVQHHTSTHTHHQTPTQAHADHAKSIDEKVLRNLVELQKVHTDLAEKFSKLSDQIASLLRLFELSAQAFAKQVNLPNIQKDSEFLDKIDKLLDQNKTIAKGLMLMEEKIRGRLGQPSPEMQQNVPFQPRTDVPRPLPRF